MDSLRKGAIHRNPGTWFRSRGRVIAVCSQGHPSQIMHNIEADGRLVAPAGVASSCHCGTCNETLPLRLDGWTVEPAPDEEPVPPPCKCDGCGVESPWISGWTHCGLGLLCPKCFAPYKKERT